MRDAELDSMSFPSAEFRRWHRTLPPQWRRAPEAALAAGIDIQARAPMEALRTFEEAARGFRAAGDVDGELAAIRHDGIVRWWANDFGGLFTLYERVGELARAGSRAAGLLRAVGLAAMAHLRGDSEGVLSALVDVGDDIAADWLGMILWLRSVAHRRNGDLQRAYDELDAASGLRVGMPAPELEIARLRIDWLRGDVDHVCAQLLDFKTHYQDTGQIGRASCRERV